jgi:hypothetical protein
MAKIKESRTPAQVVARIITAAMRANDVSSDQLAKAASVHVNTVRKDLREPEGMPMSRMWIYFLALGVPINETLKCFADSFCKMMIER